MLKVQLLSTRTPHADLQFSSENDLDTFSSVENSKKAARQNEKFELSILSSLADISQFETKWRELEAKAAKPANIFQSYDWCMNWVKTCTISNVSYGVHIITVSQNDQCLLIWPMMTTCSGPFQIMRWLSEPYSQYGDVLALEDDNLPTILNLAWQKLQSHPFVDSIRFRHVRANATIAPFLQNHAKHDGHVDYAPFLEIEKYPTEKAYDARYTKSQRRRRNRIRKDLAQYGSVKFSQNHDADTFLKTLKPAIAEKRTWLSERGLYSMPIMSDELDMFFSELAKNSKTIATIASKITAGERQISYEIGLRFKNHHFGYITAHNAKLTDSSPGRLHMDYSQRAAIADGLDAFDLMVPADPHKKTWSSNAIQTRDYYAHLNARGAIYSTAYLKTLRPLIRWLYLKAPPTIRRYIMRFVS